MVKAPAPPAGAQTAGRVQWALTTSTWHGTWAQGPEGLTRGTWERTLRELMYRGLPKSCLMMGIHDTNHTAFWKGFYMKGSILFLYKGFYPIRKKLDIRKMPLKKIKTVSNTSRLISSTWQLGAGWILTPLCVHRPRTLHSLRHGLLNSNPATDQGALGTWNISKWQLGRITSFPHCSLQ